MEERRGAALLFAGCWSLAMWWRGVAITSPRSGRGGGPSLWLSADTRGRTGEQLAKVWTVKTQTEQKRCEELAKMEAAFFALVLSLPVLFAPLLFPSSPPEGWDGKEDEAGKMADRRGAALLLVVGRSAARCCDVVAIASSRSGRGGRHFIR